MRKDLAMASSSFIYPPPTDGKPFRLVMGLRNMQPADWIEVGSELPAQLIERRELIDTKRERVFGELPGFKQPAEQFAQLIIENLKLFHASTYEVKNQIVKDLATGFQVDLTKDHPFLQLAKILGEDLCLISKVNGSWVLTAGAVVYPSRWLLAEKLGKTLDQIHQPVPGYEESLQPAMALSFDKLNSDRQVWRLNWALHSQPVLHQPTAVHQSAAPAEYWWRTERQTLTKLPGADHVLFTIRNRVEPLSQLMQRPSEAAAFAQTLSTMSNETIAYKGLTQDHKAVVDYLMSRDFS
jgi:hypothetical protein